MDTKRLTFLLLCLFCAILKTGADNRQIYEDSRRGGNPDVDEFDGSGFPDDDDDDDDDEGSGGDGSGGKLLDPIGQASTHSPYLTRSPTSGFDIDRASTSHQDVIIGKVEDEYDENYGHRDVFLHPAVLAAMIVGGVLLIVMLVLLIMFIVYRLRKKDEGSYVLDDSSLIKGDRKHHSLIYTKAPPNENEFYA